MAKVHVSPGAYFQTIDLSAYIPRLTNCSYGVVGRFVKGPTDPVVISDPQTFIDTFGVPEEGMYSALSALLYLEDGNQLYVKRLVGTASTRAVAEIPAGEIIQAKQLDTANGDDYQFQLKLYDSPIPGTLVINIGNNVFYDNGEGKILGSAVSTYCNFIDYNTGTFRFTLKDAPAKGTPIEIRYNGKVFQIEGEGVENENGKNTLAANNSAFQTFVEYPGIYCTEDTPFYVYFNDNDEPTLTGTEDVDGVVKLYDADDNEVGKVLTKSGKVNFTLSTAVAEDTVVSFDYVSIVESSYTIDPDLIDGKTTTFYGQIDAPRISPGSTSIWIGGEVVSEDNKNGDYVDYDADHPALVYSYNTIDYTDGDIAINLTFQPAKDTPITATYSAKAKSVIHVFDLSKDTLDSDGICNFSGTVDSAPIVKGTLEVVAFIRNGGEEDSIVFTDTGEGLLSCSSGQGSGTVDYYTGKISIDITKIPDVPGCKVEAYYLTKYGDMYAHYEGEYGNGYKGKFSYKADTGYNFELWTQDQNPATDSPDEYWTEIDFTSTTNRNFITNKVSSYHVDIIPNASAVENGLEPLIGQLFTTTGGYADIDSVTDDEAVEGIKAFSNPENYDVNTLACPDFAGNKKVMNALISVAEDRGDGIGVIDTPAGLTPRQAVDWSNGASSWNYTTKYDSSFGAIYYPWLIVSNPVSGLSELVPPSVVIPAMYTYTDNIAASWYAPAGINRGKLTRATGLERTLTLEERNLLYGYPNVVNPIINIPNQGIVVWGQKTTQRSSTALDRVNVRRLMNYIAKVLSTAYMELVFEPNDHITRTKYLQITTPILDEIQANRGLYSCSVVCDETLNPDSVVEQNKMRAKVYLQPMKTAEVIETTFILTRTGATIDDSSES